jgi:hypothetical protein
VAAGPLTVGDEVAGLDGAEDAFGGVVGEVGGGLARGEEGIGVRGLCGAAVH